MAKQKRSDDWGFPRWRSYGKSGRNAAKVRLCDRQGCTGVGDRPAPKAPNSNERWYFCEAHAAEYNKNWNYFAGLSPEEAARRAQQEASGANGFRRSAHWGWAGPGDETRSRDEMRALDALELESDADFKSVKAAYRRLAKENHPDVKPGDEEAARRFQTVQAAYDLLRKAEERRATVTDQA
ncbi:MAG TPA: J domain-containing protein [Sphingomicrobium sp.]|nr:J domain-containing protein [Sphingomicrobium sp.]